MQDPKQIIQTVWRTGHLASPTNVEGWNIPSPGIDTFAEDIFKPPKDLDKLTLDHPIVKQAIASYQSMMALDADILSFHYNYRPMIPDGDIGPATQDLLDVQRCAVPDFFREERAVGTGNWKRCHGVGEFHACKVRINYNTMPTWLKPIWPAVWTSLVAAYVEVGLLLIEAKDGERANTSFTWVEPDGGWIGLAIVGNNLSCTDEIWARFDKDYKGGSTEKQIINQQSSLKIHEMGHNVGLGHSRGGIMNPSIINGLPMGKDAWANDPSLSTLKKRYGGERVTGHDPGPGPGPGPGPEPDPEYMIELKVNGREFVAVPKVKV